jgi:hypothetical protein
MQLLTRPNTLCYNYDSINLELTMFESIEIRRVANGFVVTIHLEDETVEYVFDTARKAMSHIKQFVAPKAGE